MRGIITRPAVAEPRLFLEYRFLNEGDLTFNKADNSVRVASKFTGPERRFNDTTAWTKSGLTASDTGSTAGPVAGTLASSVSVTGAGQSLYQSITLTAGQWTMGAWIKSQNSNSYVIRQGFGTALLSADKTVTPTWQWVEHTDTVSAGTTPRIIVNSGSAGATASLHIVGAVLVPGATAAQFAGEVFDLYRSEFAQGSARSPSVDGEGWSFVGDKYSYARASVAESVSQITVYVVAKWSAAQNVAGYSPLFSETYTNSRLYLGADDDALGATFRFGGSSAYVTRAQFTNLKDNRWHQYRGTYDGVRLKLHIDGVLFASKVQVGLTAVNIQNIMAGVTSYPSAFGSAWPGKVAYARAYNGAHSDSQALAIEAETRALIAYRGVVPGLPNLVAAEGDSITAATAAGRGYVLKAATAATNPPWQAVEHAVQGSTMVSVNARAAAVTANFNPARRNIVSLLIGRNDLVTSITAQQHFDTVKAYCLSMRAAGAKIVLGTLPPSTSGGYNAKRNAWNTLVYADNSFYDVLADYAADPTMGPDAAASDTTYYSDGTHPTDAGQVILSGIFSAALATQLV